MHTHHSGPGKVIWEGRLPEELKTKGRGNGGVSLFTFRNRRVRPRFHSRTTMTDGGVVSPASVYFHGCSTTSMITTPTLANIRNGASVVVGDS
ncbi:hypothetical protein WA026_014388 [Henosepilachna vigintioctopunctata]|uniref:Uncharacterized protein n=1 Tax=Henosepilachna vigintioctopunctata TaxID=420089 RepID=A0AAW1UKK6_9CUCU